MESNNFHLIRLLKNLVEASEKAARIAQICRSDQDLFSLLVQEKGEEEKNMRFVHDFKTLADVLVQETIGWNVSKQFPQLQFSIFGEENNHFENMKGESIEIHVSDSYEETRDLIATILDKCNESAEALCQGIYAEVNEDIKVSEAACETVVPGNTIGIWIDPIDCTGEYVQGIFRNMDDTLISSGLECVCVVIGVYDLTTGFPVAGVVNQPFFMYSECNNRWKSRYFWSLCYGDIKETSFTLETFEPAAKKTIVISGCENKNLVQIVTPKYNVRQVAGSGYKSLLVACGEADLYVLSFPTTYFWDTCGPHALLSALGGGIVDFERIIGTENLSPEDLPAYQLKYTTSPPRGGVSKVFCNLGGIAYREPDTLLEFLQLLKEADFHMVV